MAKSNPEPAREPGKQSIEALQDRYRSLDTKKIQAETMLNNARERLDELKREALEKFKTDDVGELQKMLERMREENEAKRAQYQAHLDQIENELEAVEQKFATLENVPNRASEPS